MLYIYIYIYICTHTNVHGFAGRNGRANGIVCYYQFVTIGNDESNIDSNSHSHSHSNNNSNNSNNDNNNNNNNNNKRSSTSNSNSQCRTSCQQDRWSRREKRPLGPPMIIPIIIQ